MKVAETFVFTKVFAINESEEIKRTTRSRRPSTAACKNKAKEQKAETRRVETAREKASTRTTATTATGGGPRTTGTGTSTTRTRGGTKTSGSSNSSGRRKAKARTPPRTREESSGTSDPEKGQPRRSSSERVYKCT